MTLQVFDNKEEFKNFIKQNDSLKEFKPQKREINWTIKTKNCKECGKRFETRIPVKIFCDDCANKPDKIYKQKPVIERLKQKGVTKNCVTCGSEFYLEAPAMRNCEKCSNRGGTLVAK